MLVCFFSSTKFFFPFVGDGGLSHEEFIAVMQNRVQRGFGVSTASNCACCMGLLLWAEPRVPLLLV